MGFFVLGLNYKNCPLAVRELLAFRADELEQATAELCALPEISELVLLSTCNRVEFYGYSESREIPDALIRWFETYKGTLRGTFEPFLYRKQGRDALSHLFRVACGLDSLVVGENEILGQLRDAFRAASQAGAAGAFLGRLMEKALKVGKDVRTKTRINEGAVSIPSVAVELAEKIFGNLASKKIMVLGTGEMASSVMRNLKAAGAETWTVASRSPEKGKILADEFQAEWLPQESWTRALPQADIVITATSSPHPIVHAEEVRAAMAARRRPLFFVDIAVPRDVDADVNTIEDVYLYNIDDLKGVAEANIRLRRREIQEADKMTEQALVDFEGWFEGLRARPVLESFEVFIDGVLETELERFGRERGLASEELDDLKRRLRAKLMHPPLEKIKEASQLGSLAKYLEALDSLFDLKRKPSPEKDPLKP